MVEDVEVKIDIGDDGNILPEKNDKVLLIDADTIVYTACLSANTQIDVMPVDFYTEAELHEITNKASYNEADGTYKEVDLEAAVQYAKDKITKMLDITGCKSCDLHFSEGKKNFRYKIYPDYKANRKSLETPEGLREVRDLLSEIYFTTTHTEWEADDAVIFLYKTYPDNYVLAAVDKDVYNSVPGKHLNYFECNYVHHKSGLPVVRNMHMVDISADEARMWAYVQVILGDKTDNIKGIPGIGEKSVQKYINSSMNEIELWNGIKAACATKNHPLEEAILTMHLVNMHQLVKDDNNVITVKLWEEPEDE